MKTNDKSSGLTPLENRRLVAAAIDCFTVFGLTRNDSYEYEFPAEVVKARQRIGIQRGFLNSLTATSLSCVDVAKELDAFCRSKIAKGKFFPTFSIQPNELLDTRQEKTLVTIIQKHRHCLFDLPLEGREDRLRLGVRFLAEHFHDRPIITLINIRESSSLTSLIDIAHRYPQIRFILTRSMWGSDGLVHSAMTEAENMLTETSLGHTSDRTELFIDHYGSHRIVFGLGYRAIGGAALGAVLHSKISKADKQAILYDNIERWLDLPKLAERELPEIENKEWKYFLERGRSRQPGIDVHGHFGPVAGWPVRDQSEAVQIPRKSAEMSKQNLEYFIFSHSRALFAHAGEGNRIAEKQLLAVNDPRLRAYYVYNPRYAKDLDPYLEKVPYSKIFVGFKLLNDYWQVPITDAGFEPVWEVANKHHLPILIHTWEGSFDSPRMLESIVPRYPHARFFIAHCGGTNNGRVEAEALAKAHANVYLEWCGSFLSQKPWERTIRELGAEKLIFGTDGIFHSHDWELARLLSLDLTKEEFRFILHDNAASILTPLLKKRTLSSIYK